MGIFVLNASVEEAQSAIIDFAKVQKYSPRVSFPDKSREPDTQETRIEISGRNPDTLDYFHWGVIHDGKKCFVNFRIKLHRYIYIGLILLGILNIFTWMILFGPPWEQGMYWFTVKWNFRVIF